MTCYDYVFEHTDIQLAGLFSYNLSYLFRSSCPQSHRRRSASCGRRRGAAPFSPSDADICRQWGGRPQQCLPAWFRYGLLLRWPPHLHKAKGDKWRLQGLQRGHKGLYFPPTSSFTWSVHLVSKRHQNSKLHFLFVTWHWQQRPATELLLIHLQTNQFSSRFHSTRSLQKMF